MSLPSSFWHWAAWRLRNKKGPRPADSPKDIPKSWWAALERWTARHKKKPAPSPAPPPPPPPVAHSRWTSPPWAGLGAHVAWAFTSGQYTPEQLAGILQENGFKWAAIEGSPAMDNEAFFARFITAMHALGLKVGLWERADIQKDYPESRIDHVTRLLNSYDFDFYGADLESFPVDTPDFPTQFAKAFPDKPRIMLDAGMADASNYKLWIEADFDFMTQAYSGPMGKDPAKGIAGAMDSDAKWRMIGAVGHEILNFCGFHSVAILEVNSENSASLKDQLPAVAQWGTNFSIWDAESMTEDDWATARSITGKG